MCRPQELRDSDRREHETRRPRLIASGVCSGVLATLRVSVDENGGENQQATKNKPRAFVWAATAHGVSGEICGKRRPGGGEKKKREIVLKRIETGTLVRDPPLMTIHWISNRSVQTLAAAALL